jgi:hypothetical protein
MSKAKKSAHVVVVEMVQLTLEVIFSEKKELDPVKLIMWVGMLSAQLEILRRITLSAEERQWVIESLHRLKDYYPKERVVNLDKLFSDSLFADISVQ